MEDILSLSEAPSDPSRPVIGYDERPCQLIGEVLMPLPLQPGRPRHQDDEYARHGTCCVLLAFEPRRCWRFVQVHAQRTALDYAHFMQALVATYDPSADKDLPRPRELAHAHARLLLRGISPPGSVCLGSKGCVTLHAAQSQVAEYGGHCVLRIGATMLGPTHWRYGHLDTRSRHVGHETQPSPQNRAVEIYPIRCQQKARWQISYYS